MIWHPGALEAASSDDDKRMRICNWKNKADLTQYGEVESRIVLGHLRKFVSGV